MPKLCACLLFAMTCSRAFAMFLYGPLPKTAAEELNTTSYHYYDSNGFDENGLDHEGYDEDGFDLQGLDAYGYDKNGHHIDGYDKDGYDQHGFDQRGFNRNGFDWDGFDEDGFDSEGFNREGYDEDGFDRQGLDEQGYDRDGFDTEGFNKEGFDTEGYDENGFNAEGFDRNGFNNKGFDKRGYNSEGFNAWGFNQDGDTNGINKEGFTQYGVSRDYNPKLARLTKRKQDKRIKHNKRSRTISLHTAEKRVLETESSRKQQKTALQLAKAMKIYNAQQDAENNPPIPTEMEQAGEWAECVINLELAQPESPEVIDGKWVYNRVDRKDRHMPPRGKLNESKGGFHVLSKKQLSQLYPDKQLKQCAPCFFSEPKLQPTCPVPGGIQIPWGWLL